MPNSILLRTLAAAVLAVTFIGTSSCSKDDDSDKDKGGKSSLNGQTGKVGQQPNGGGMPSSGGSGPSGGSGSAGSGSGSLPGGGTSSGPDEASGSTPGGGSNPVQPLNPADPGTPGGNGGNNGDTPQPPVGGNQPDPEEEKVYEMLTQVFMTYLPLGTYTGTSDSGTSCTAKVTPFDSPGKDLMVEMEISGGSDGSPNDKITFVLSPKISGTLVGAPKENPPVLRMWVEVAIPTMTMMGSGHAITMLNVKFDPATNKAESIYIFDQTREGLANSAANCFVSSFTPASAPSN